jgi:DNA-binding CsgD family transcriptional regulator
MRKAVSTMTESPVGRSMSYPPLPGSKFMQPRLTGRELVRSGLLDRMTACRTLRLTEIIAPAGYGKTMLAAVALQHPAECSHAWLALDSDDDDPLRLAAALIAALAPLCPDGAAAARQWLGYGRPTDALTALLAEVSVLSRPIVLVLDDVQRLTQAAVHDVLHSVVMRSPAQLHWLLISRQQLPFSTARLLIEAQLLSLSAADLRLSRRETAAYLATEAPFPLDDGQIQLITERTAGWLAGVQLTLLTLRRAAAPVAMPELALLLRGDQRLLSDYLTGEVFTDLPDDLKDFLLDCALVERLHPDLCTAISGRADSVMLLAEVERRRLFLQALDAFGDWYVLHSLWREFLLGLARRQRSSAQRQSAARRAAGWLRTHGDMPAALRCLIATEQADLAATYVSERARTMLAEYRLSELQHWYSLLPTAAIAGSTALLTARGWLELMLGRLDALAVTMRQLDDVPLAADVDDVLVLTQFQRLSGGDLVQIFHGLWQLRERLDRMDAFVAGWGWLLLGLCFQPDLAPEFDGRSCTERARTAFRRAAADFGELYARTTALAALRRAGDFASLAAECRAGLQFAAANRDLAAAREAIGAFAVSGGEALFWMDRLPEAVELFRLAYDDARAMRNSIYARQAALWLTICRAAGADIGSDVPLPEADEWLWDPAAATWALGERGILLHLAALRSLLPGGSVTDCAVAVETLQISWRELRLEAPDSALIGSAAALIARRTIDDDLMRWLETVMAHAEACGRLRLRMHIIVLAAVCARISGRYSRARALLRQALPMLEIRQAYRLPLLFPELLPTLRSIAHPLAHELPARQQRNPFRQSLDLSAQERRILHLIADGASNGLIAETLRISEPTVKWYLYRLYRRLELKNRRAAAAWVREHLP